MDRAKQLERENNSLHQKLELLLQTISEQLGDGNPITLQQAVIKVRLAGESQKTMQETKDNLEKKERRHLRRIEDLQLELARYKNRETIQDLKKGGG